VATPLLSATYQTVSALCIIFLFYYRLNFKATQ
jgi:hypothetical protein